MSAESSTRGHGAEFVVSQLSPEQLRHLGETVARAVSSGDEALHVTTLQEAENLVSSLLREVCLKYNTACGDDGVYRHVKRLVDRSLVEAALKRAEGCQVRAAELLGISRNTLRSKMAELEIRSADYA